MFHLSPMVFPIFSHLFLQGCKLFPSVSFTCTMENSGRIIHTMAATPATWGVAIEVPLSEAYLPLGMVL